MLQPDPTLEGFNCYVSQGDATVILGTRLDVPAWDEAGETNQKRALLMATRLLDRYVTWYGIASANDQPLSWPRKEVKVYNRDAYFTDTEIPDFLQVATAEYAAELLKENLSSDPATGLTSLRVGPIALNFNKGDRKGAMPTGVKLMVNQYGTINTGRDSVVRVVRR